MKSIMQTEIGHWESTFIERCSAYPTDFIPYRSNLQGKAQTHHTKIWFLAYGDCLSIF